MKKQARQGAKGGVWTKHEPPGIEEALFAASGLSDDPEERIEIATALIGRPIEEVRQVARRMANQQAITIDRPRLSLHRPDRDRRPAAPRTVIVERVRTRAFRMA